MFSKVVEYGAVITVIVLAAAGVWEDFLAKKSLTRRVVMSAMLLVASIIVVVNQYETDKQHERDAGQISGLKNAVKQANDTQQKNAAQFLQGQDSSRQEFLKQFNQLGDKVAKLQTQAATEALQKQAAELQAELHSTEQALNPPKAELQFSFESARDTPIRTTSLPRDLQGNITVRFTVMNMTQAVANDGFVSFQICDECTFIKEPDGFKRVEGERATELNYDFQRILPMQALPVFEDSKQRFVYHLSRHSLE